MQYVLMRSHAQCVVRLCPNFVKWLHGWFHGVQCGGM